MTRFRNSDIDGTESTLKNTTAAVISLCVAIYCLVWNAYYKTKDALGTVFYSNGSIRSGVAKVWAARGGP